MEKHDLGLRSGGKSLETLRAARIEEVRLRCQKLRQELAVSKGQAIPAATVHAMFKHFFTDLRTYILFAVESELPVKLDGLPAIAARKILREWLDAFIENMQQTMVRFNANNPDAKWEVE